MYMIVTCCTCLPSVGSVLHGVCMLVFGSTSQSVPTQAIGVVGPAHSATTCSIMNRGCVACSQLGIPSG